MSSSPKRSLRETIALAKAADRSHATNGDGPSGARNGRRRQGSRASGGLPPAMPPSELTRRREVIAARYAEQQWDLGGLVYEMAIRDHFRLDVLQREAGRLQETDGELAAIERLEKLESEGAAGTCPGCSAPYARGASFCWRCGQALTDTMVVR